jgi:molybdenum cofactor guanylyltransferase
MMTSIIVAGGTSSRLGRNKAIQVVQGKSLIQRVVDRIAILSNEVIIATARGEAIPCSSKVRIRTVADIYSSKGPLGGIHSGLTASSSPQAIIVGCDTPFLSVSLLEYMTQICPAFDIVVPRIKNEVEPLCAVYSKNCLGPIKELLERDERQIRVLFDMVKVKYVEEDEIDNFDPQHLSFFNINSQKDLELARKLAVDKVKETQEKW